MKDTLKDSCSDGNQCKGSASASDNVRQVLSVACSVALCFTTSSVWAFNWSWGTGNKSGGSKNSQVGVSNYANTDINGNTRVVDSMTQRQIEALNVKDRSNFKVSRWNSDTHTGQPAASPGSSNDNSYQIPAAGLQPTDNWQQPTSNAFKNSGNAGNKSYLDRFKTNSIDNNNYNNDNSTVGGIIYK